nr:hypothetical protein [Tanacetum cinerariifolium]
MFLSTMRSLTQHSPPPKVLDTMVPFSNQPKRTRESVQAISVASEDALSKRIRDPTAIVGNRRPRRVTYGSEEGCSSSHNGGKRPTLLNSFRKQSRHLKCKLRANSPGVLL